MLWQWLQMSLGMYRYAPQLSHRCTCTALAFSDSQNGICDGGMPSGRNFL